VGDKVSEKNTGLHFFLTFAPIYSAFQNALGAKRFRKKLVTEFFDLKAGLTVLDLGCGPGDLLEFLPSGVRYCGIDYNEKYISSAMKRFGSRGEFILGDLRLLKDLNRQFDRIVMIGFLHHLDDEEAKSLIDLTSKVLAKDGVLVAVENVFEPNQNAVAKFLISQDRGQHVRTRENYAKLMSCSYQKVKTEVKHDFLRVPYSHVVITAHS